MVDFITGVAAQLTAKVVELTFVAVRQICRYTRNVENLRSKIDELGNTKDELQGRVDQATRDRDIIKEEVLKYITDADCLSREAQTFLETDCERAVIKCFGGSLPNLMSRRRLSKQAKEKADELLRAIQAAPGDGFLVVPSRPALHSCIADRGSYAGFETREEILRDIMAALSNSEVRKVGVYGMGGVGKTMLAKEVARRATEKKLFSEVVFSTVSQTIDLKAIQQVVADKIELKFEATESVAGRADRLKRRLTEERKILIILDDIWDSLDLVQVGLNFDNDQKGCKILMTSRSLEVTRNSMGAEINIMVGHLSPVEARNLFTTIVGTNVVERQDFQSSIDDVVGECRGLPLAIATLANALKTKSLSVWQDALLQLQNSDLTNIPEMLKDVYPSIRLSFDYLESKEAKNLLLLCSLYGEDVEIEVDELMMLSLGWGLCQNIHSMAAAKRRIESLVGILKDRCLLLDGFDCDCVKMHDVTRDVAITIASEDSWGMHSFMINDTLEDRLSEKSFKETKALSLLRNSDSIQPPKRELECPQLELFLISPHYFYGNNYLQIPIMDFLNESTHLKVLSLYGAHFLIKLPTSLKFLQNLRTLRLHKCKLDDIDYIGDLINLRVLDLRSSTFQQLPSKIGELTSLQLLNLRGCKDLRVIRESVISSLTRLEELYMPANFKNWDAGKVATDRRNANVAELMKLQKLTTLFLSIPDAKILPKGFVFSEKLERYRIGIGIEYDDNIRRAGLSRSLVLRDCDESLLMAHGLEALMRSSEGLKLGGLAGGMIKNNVVYDPDKDGFPKLKILKLSDCDEAQDVVDALEQKSTIHPSKLTTDSFKQLREVEVSNCGRLKNLFPLSIAKRLHKIEVIDCKSVEEIVEHDDQLREDEAAFDELLFLRLQSLPKLVQFICWPQLGVTTASSSVESANYPLFGEKVALPKLGTLDLSGIHVKKLWADQLPSTFIHMQNLSKMYVKKCNELEYLSSVDVAKSLVKLQKMEIEECRSLELIFLVTKKQGGEEDGTLLSEKLSLPQLQTLHLSDLPNLKMLCATVDKKNAQLGEQEPLFNGMVAFPKLESLRLSKIVVNVKYLSSLCVAKSLESLEIEYCTSLEVIFLVSKKQGGDEDGTLSPEKISLPQLKTLWIRGLPNLKTLCATVDKEIMQRGEQEPFVNGMIELSGLHTLRLFELNIERLWPDFDGKLLATTSYMENLTSLTVSKCNKLKYLISFAMAERLVKLKELEVRECSEMECIVVVRKRLDGEDQRSSKQILFPKLTSIRLRDLSGLKSFCQGADDCIQLPALLNMIISGCPELKTFVDKQGENELATKSFFHEKMIIFPRLESLRLRGINITKLWEDHRHSVLTCMPNLKVLDVRWCDNLKYLFSSTVCTSPFPLERLFIMSCKGMEEVVAITEEPRSKAMSALSVSLLFSKLKFLSLWDLPKLKQFCKGDIVELPLLSVLTIQECSEVRAFIVDSTANEKQLEEMDKQPLFSHKVVFPCLRHVWTDWKEAIDEIFGLSQFPSKELKELHVKCPTHDEPISLSILEILHRYQNLETLELSGSFVNIKTCQRDDQDERILAQSLARPLMSFHNLTELQVSECHELTYLLDSSVARSLAQLKAMSIRSCRKMKDIIRDCEEGETTEDEAFDFKRLEILVLGDLPTLKSFYSGNNAMMFPKLEKLILSQCPEMKSFSHGIMTASLLVTIITETEHESWNWLYIKNLKERAVPIKECWNGDVNTTIRKLWEESSNSSSQQPSAVTVVEDCSGEGTSTKGAGM